MESKKEVNWILAFSAFAFMLAFSGSASAAPHMENLMFSPSNPIMINGLVDNVVISVDCDADPVSSSVFAEIKGPVIPPKINMAWNGSYFVGIVKGESLAKAGIYAVNVTCICNLSQTSLAGSFIVSEVKGIIMGIDPQTVYVGEGFDAYFLVKKDGFPVSSLVENDFQAKLNGQDKDLGFMYYTDEKGYKLRIDDTPQTKGTYDLSITAVYMGKEISNETEIEVKEPVELELLSIDKNYLSGSETLTLKMRMVDHGTAVKIREDYLDITINSAKVEIAGITEKDDYSIISIKLPALDPGSYELVVKANYNGYTKTIKKDIFYTIPVSGKISQNGKGIILEIQFRDKNGILTTFTTDNNGEYRGALAPGTYDVTLKHSESTLTLEGVKISGEFSDPIRYYSESSKEIPGIESAGLFFYETALSYDLAVIKMNYNERAVEVPESSLKVYRCGEWNGEECYSEWQEVAADIDTVRDTARVSTSGKLSAYAIGARKGIVIQAGTDKEEYYLYETAVIEGIASVDDSKALGDALVTLTIKGTSKTKQTRTNDEGVFSVEFDVPEKEGSYEIQIEVDKPPYTPMKATKSFSVSKSREISIDIPGGIRMEAGKNKTVDFTVKNTGQAALHGVSVYMENAPEGIVISLDREKIDSIEPSEEIVIAAEFKSTDNSTGTFPMTVRAEAEGDGVSAEKAFALTAQKGSSGAGTAQQNMPQPDFSLVGSFIADVGASYGYLFALFLGSVSFAFIMRKKRISRGGERTWVKNMLSSINQEISRAEMNKSRKNKRKEV